MKRVAVIGTVGVPAKYGGFETLVENIIGENCSQNVEYIVFCSLQSYKQQLKEYRGAKLKYIPLKANGSQSIFYDIISIFSALHCADILLVLGVSGCLILPFVRLLSSKKTIVNIDGLEHRRDKWGKWTRRFLKFSEAMAVKYADVIIADNKGIQDYVKEEYCIESELIAYGGDHVQCDTSDIESSVLKEYALQNCDYSFSLCRIEPENNVHITLEAFKKAGKHLVFVGNWERSLYGKTLLEDYSKCENIHLLSPVYDLKVLNVLRRNCSFYIHGHSAGGTNPSLVEAMFFQKPILSFDVVYNRETTEHKADYFSSVQELTELLQKSYSCFQQNAESMIEIAQRRYRWEIVARQYEALF